jgi:hypothetical protein
MEHNHLNLQRAIERVVRNVCKLQPSALWFAVNEVEVIGRPAERIKVWATLRTPEGSQQHYMLACH